MDLEEVAYLFRAESLPPARFEPDMRGLKRVHRHLFGDVYEWAGYARHEPVIVDGEVIEPREHGLAKGAVEFASSEVSRTWLPWELARRRDALSELRERGTLEAADWWQNTAEAIARINWAHPFLEGNGRAMRHFIGCSTEYYGFECTVPKGGRWVEACADAMRSAEARSLVALLADHTRARSRAKEQPRSPDRGMGG